MGKLQLAHRARECKFRRARPGSGSTVALAPRVGRAVYNPVDLFDTIEFVNRQRRVWLECAPE
jgi:hypothetical protein